MLTVMIGYRWNKRNIFHNKIWLLTCTAFGIDNKQENANKIIETKYDKRIDCCYIN